MTIKTCLFSGIWVLGLLMLPIKSGQTQAMVLAPLDSKAAPLESPLPGQSAKEGGWDALARFLDAVKPSVDTQPPLSPSEMTAAIEKRINAGHYQSAQALIEQRLAATRSPPPSAAPAGGIDVQLKFQQARLLAAMGHTHEALTLYTMMTCEFPELPEPWNNLAAIYTARGQVEQARMALENALRSAPDDPVIRANLVALQSRQKKLSDAPLKASFSSCQPSQPFENLRKNSIHP